jgi:hypothetical protein
MADSLSSSKPLVREQFDEEFDLTPLDTRLQRRNEPVVSPKERSNRDILTVTVFIIWGRS